MSEIQGKPNKPVSLRCRLNYPDEETFIRKYASNVSKTGIFAKTKNPLPVGEQIQFDFFLPDGTELIKGIGKVAWNRSGSPSGAPPGMGIKFLKLDKKGKALIDRIIEYKERLAEAKTISRYSMDASPAIEMGHIAEPHQLGAEPEMTFHNKKPTLKIDLDAIDSMLEQIAREPISKKKHLHKKRISTTPHAPSNALSPPAAPEKGTALEEAAHGKPVSTSKIGSKIMPEPAPNLLETAGDTPRAEPPMPPPITTMQTAVTVQPDFAVDESTAEGLPMEEVAFSALSMVVKEDEEVIEEIELTGEEIAVEETEVTAAPLYAPEEEPAKNQEDLVMNLGLEHETFQDVEPAREVSVNSVLPNPPAQFPLISSVPPHSISSVPPHSISSVPPHSISSAPPSLYNAKLSSFMPAPVGSVESVPPVAAASQPPMPMPSAMPPRTDPRAPIYSSYMPAASHAQVYSSYMPAASPPQPVYPSAAPQPVYPSAAPQPVYPSAAPQPVYSSITPQPVYSSVAPQTVYPSITPQTVYPSITPQPVYPASRPSVAPQPTYLSSAPPNAPLSLFPSSVPPAAPPSHFSSSVPPDAPPSFFSSSSVPPRTSQVPALAMAQEELSGILGEPTHDEAQIRTDIIQEDELEALLSALEDSEAPPFDAEEIEEINDMDDLEVIEVDEVDE